MLGGLEDWLYSQEADDADLAELKDKRRQASFFFIRFIAFTLQMNIAACMFPRFTLS